MDNVLYEMIAAFAAGCMDKDNFVQFKDYFDSGGELPVQVLGELQNITAMIPVILDLETPDAAIKDLVAKKLIGLQEEIKTKIREERRTGSLSGARGTAASPRGTFASSATAPSRSTFQFIEKKKEETAINDKARFTKVPDAIKKTSILPSSALPAEEPQQAYQSQAPLPQRPVEKQSSGIAGWLGIILALALFSIVGYYSFSSISALEEKLEELKNQVTSLRSELAASNTFVSNYSSLIEFFNYKDVTVYHLTGKGAEQASARLLLSFEQKEGLIQFKNFKPLQPNQGYQLWFVSRGVPYSIGVYTPAGNEYLRISSFPFVPKEGIESFKVTIESNTGSPTPSIETYLESIVTPRR